MAQQSADLFQLLGQEFIDSVFEEGQRLLQNLPIDKTTTNIYNDKIPPFNKQLAIWMTMKPLPSGNMEHVYYKEMDYPFTPECFVLFEMQCNKEILQKMDSSLEDFEVVDKAIKGNVMAVVSKLKLKRILMIPEKNFFVLRLIKRVNNNEYMDISKSVELTPLI